METMESVAKTFVRRALRYQNKIGSDPICIGPADVVTNINEWLDKKIVKKINDCDFPIKSYVICMAINMDITFTIEGMVNGKNDEHEFNICLSKPQFIEQLTNMLTFYKDEKFNICIYGDEIISKVDAINDIFKK